MLRLITPCDYTGMCPYNAETMGGCEYWCGQPEPQDGPEIWAEDVEDEVDESGFNPYTGSYDFDCQAVKSGPGNCIFKILDNFRKPCYN